MATRGTIEGIRCSAKIKAMAGGGQCQKLGRQEGWKVVTSDPSASPFRCCLFLLLLWCSTDVRAARYLSPIKRLAVAVIRAALEHAPPKPQNDLRASFRRRGRMRRRRSLPADLWPTTPTSIVTRPMLRAGCRTLSYAPSTGIIYTTPRQRLGHTRTSEGLHDLHADCHV